MQVRISFPRRIFDLMMPRLCTVCHERLGITEDSICMACNLHLPRTAFCSSPYDNEMAQLFLGTDADREGCGTRSIICPTRHRRA